MINRRRKKTKTKAFPTEIRNKTRHSLLFNIVLKSLSYSNKTREKNKRDTNRKEKVKVSIFANDMILCVRDPKDS